MSDFVSLIQNLEAKLPAIREAMTPQEWEDFKRRLAEAVPYLQQAADNLTARLEAFYLLQEACDEFPAARGVLPAPGGLVTDPSGLQPNPASIHQETIPTHQMEYWIKKAEEICRNPGGFIIGRPIPHEEPDKGTRPDEPSTA